MTAWLTNRATAPPAAYAKRARVCSDLVDLIDKSPSFCAATSCAARNLSGPQPLDHFVGLTRQYFFRGLGPCMDLRPAFSGSRGLLRESQQDRKSTRLNSSHSSI